MGFTGVAAYVPFVAQAVAEFPAALASLREQLSVTEEPALEPAPRTPGARTVDDLLTSWFAE